ncbi:MAG: vitamin K epoxide reductase family protein [Anaerolineales bacterium]|nr:vitamin K epoxide reductase family protein [Anaerolineales bacterium]
MKALLRRSAPLWRPAAVILCLCAIRPAQVARAQNGVPVVRAVLFHSPMCTFCAEIIETELPPRIERFGRQLDILLVNMETAEGMALYQAALEAYQVTGGIPVLFIDGIALKGEAIPQQLPELVESALAQGGLDWPDIPGLDEYRQSLQASATPRPTNTAVFLTPTFAPVPSPQGADGGGTGAVARVLLFFSPTCGHCRYVQTMVMPPIRERFGQKLEVAEVDTHTEAGHSLYQSAHTYFAMDRGGVPFLIIGRQYLLGSDEIEEYLPSLIEQALAQGGADWPAVPGLSAFLETGEEKPPETGYLEQLRANLARDPRGNAVSVLVLAGMLASLAATLILLLRSPDRLPARTPAWLTPGLCLIGLGVASYLSYVEVGRVEAVCGPVGDCNTVQQSAYARLFGILPIGVLGVIGYVLILGAWALGRISTGRRKALADLSVFGMSAFGFLFSIYLTFLEPFVIGATCMWCLASAVLMAALYWVSLHPGQTALSGLDADIR